MPCAAQPSFRRTGGIRGPKPQWSETRPARCLLVDVAQQCNAQLPDVAAAVVAAWEGEPLSRLMRSSLRRLYSGDRGCDAPTVGGAVRKGKAMIHTADVREWRDWDVVDSEDHTIGVLEARKTVLTYSDLPEHGLVRHPLTTLWRLRSRDRPTTGCGVLSHRCVFATVKVRAGADSGPDLSVPSSTPRRGPGPRVRCRPARGRRGGADGR